MPPTEDDPETMPDDALLAMPGEAIPAGRLTAFFSRRAAVLQQREMDEMMLELSGNSARHFVIFAEMDPRLRQLREDDERRREWQEREEQREYNRRTERLLAQIEAQQQAIEIRRKDIENRALRLKDGRKAFVDGSQYRDEWGNVLEGNDRDEAVAEHALHPDASTWNEREQAIRDAEEAQRLKDKILQDRDGQGATADKAAKLTTYEQEFKDKIEARAAQTLPDYGGDEFQLSSVPAFTDAAFASHETIDQPADREGEREDSKKTLRPAGSGALKLG